MMPGLGGFRNLGLILKLKSHENISSVNNSVFSIFDLLKIKVVSLWVWPIVSLGLCGRLPW